MTTTHLLLLKQKTIIKEIFLKVSFQVGDCNSELCMDHHKHKVVPSAPSACNTVLYMDLVHRSCFVSFWASVDKVGLEPAKCHRDRN